jgi:hypothetical protein
LIGAGDHYKANTFQLVKWAELDRYVRHELKEAPSKYHTNQGISSIKTTTTANNNTITIPDDDNQNVDQGHCQLKSQSLNMVVNLLCKWRMKI